MKKLIYGICLGLAILGICGGCTVTDMSEEEKTPVEYHVVSNEDIPEEVMPLIEEKMEQDFQITYQDGEDLYLIRGYGRQERGGYSIQVEELSKGESAIIVKTSLIGPSKEEKQVMEPSFPYIVLKIQYQDVQVQFQ